MEKLSLEERLDQLEKQNRYLSDYIAIWKLQSLYCQYINIGKVKAIVDLFADSDDVKQRRQRKNAINQRSRRFGHPLTCSHK